MRKSDALAAIALLALATGCTKVEETDTGTEGAADTAAAEQTPMESALSAGPDDVTGDATVLDADGNVLREGSNGWTCIAETPGMGPMCNDATWMEALGALQAGEAFPTGKFGVSYMLAGEGGAPGVSNLDPGATEPTDDNMWIKDGPHLMIILPDPALYEGMTNDTSAPVYVMWKDTPFAHLMVRIAPADE
ncbi:hypothetical protein K3165_07085 [Qipengyuania sp. 1XM1-15A]|uniref:hypothetical protein n=1 Tax=Qipengyuania xiamenensis TaxID=2867237 RepID=UPI001C86FE94|nr:hypothetical protein [Qipengyuania xiamenensis]MBX7532681.1 hypothetical protein [Qipengyuania xiamenensis]